MLFGLGLGIAVAAVGSAVSRSPLVGGASGLLAAGLIFVSAAWSLAYPDRRGALELINDHHAIEQAEWRAEVGGRIPVGIARQERWLRDHPSGPGRATVLQVLGRLEDADVAINEREPTTPDERFGVELHCATSQLLAGHRPDLAPLAALLPGLPDPAQRHHRRECLALLEALIAVADGQDPLVPLAAARREIDTVAPSARLERLLVRWAVAGVAAIVAAALVGSVVS